MQAKPPRRGANIGCRKVVRCSSRHLAQEDHLKDTKTPEELHTLSLKNWGQKRKTPTQATKEERSNNVDSERINDLLDSENTCHGSSKRMLPGENDAGDTSGNVSDGEKQDGSDKDEGSERPEKSKTVDESTESE
ncbi:hypothetical protein BKA93DRAFT_747435 [Sparassis latifolia]